MAVVEKLDWTAYDLSVPSNEKYDTTSGNVEQVHVKYDDYSFYPKYIVYYTRKM